MNLSNTALLERSFNWTGILAEPARRWHEVLTRNRRCAIDTRCVWSDSNQRLNFAETGEAELSTLSRFVEIKDPHREKRRTAIEYEVDTVSLNDLLEEYSAPDSIDYVSVDTEGSEYEILSAFDFDRRQIRVITVEHNYDGDQRNRLHGLLVERGFVRVLEDTSAWDDWYVNRSMVPLPELRASD